MTYLISCIAIVMLAITASAQTRVAANPVFSAVTMNGKTVDTAKLRGKIVVLNLWFINCPNCLQEIEQLNDLVDEYKGNKDVVFIGLAASRKPDLERFLARYPFKYQIVPDATMLILTRFGTPDRSGEINVPFPMHYVLDREGNVTVRARGIAGIEFVKSELKRQLAAKK